MKELVFFKLMIYILCLFIKKADEEDNSFGINLQRNRLTNIEETVFKPLVKR